MADSDRNGQFVTNKLQCFDNTQNYIEVFFSQTATPGVAKFQVLLRQGLDFSQGKVLYLDNSGGTLTVKFGGEDLTPAANPLSDTQATAAPVGEFYLTDADGKKSNKLSRSQIEELLGLTKRCVEKGSFFVTIEDDPIKHFFLG